ncbi:MAG: dihydrodipicolinate synthase family protein [Deltaproteobacteria bacterium]|nr:MAG: dihydrodipicolinate synthase family protein [Deltaproteobacteria bacterium]
MIQGVLLPVITPFDERGRVDEIVLRNLVEFYVDVQVQGLFLLGSSGQGPVMSIPERMRAAEIAIDQTRSRVPVVIHVGTADAESTVQLSVHAADKGASAVAVIPPYYYSDHTEYEIVAHYRAVADAVSLPIFIYENPKYSGISISPELAVRMKETVPSIRGIKVAYGMGGMLEYVRLLPPDVSVFTGNADLFGLVPFGLAGMINPPTSFVPELCVALWQALRENQYEKAVDLQSKVNNVARIVAGALRRYGRSALAEVFRMRGFAIKRFPKWETRPMPEDAREALFRDLQGSGCLE